MTDKSDPADYERVIEIGQRVLVITIIINGSAAAALLAFISSIWANEISLVTVIFLTAGIGAFALGVFFGARAIGKISIAEIFRLGKSKDPAVERQQAAVRGGKYSLCLFLVGMCATIIAIFAHFLCGP